jgi:hypothetical protein
LWDSVTTAKLFAIFAAGVRGVLSKIARSAESFDKRSIRTSLHHAAHPRSQKRIPGRKIRMQQLAHLR